MEIAILESFHEGQGVASALLAQCVAVALGAGAARLWLITTNDNVEALRFYQRRGFVLVAVHRDAVTRARETVKPELPLVGFHEIPLRDEIELELPRANWQEFVERHAWPT
jgi:ribosomal protein S18 acetylase RimI-like enzyme